jgi:hypothetical protein
LRPGLRSPGVKHVEHVYFYEVAIAEPPRLHEYLRRARRLGREFAVPTPPRPPAGAARGEA